LICTVHKFSVFMLSRRYPSGEGRLAVTGWV
jgi:hypothetical protein